MKLESIRKMLNPQSVAVIGATENPGYGQRLMSNLLKTKFPGKLYPVNPNYKEVFGVPCYPSIAAIGEPVDFAVVIVKAGLVEGVIEDCAKNKVGAALIITAGFSEFDKVKGSAREQKIREIARQSGTRLVGPNCVGLANVQQNLWATSISNIQSDMLPAGKAGLVSQSGATGFGPLLNTARDRRVGLPSAWRANEHASRTPYPGTSCGSRSQWLECRDLPEPRARSDFREFVHVPRPTGEGAACAQRCARFRIRDRLEFRCQVQGVLNSAGYSIDQQPASAANDISKAKPADLRWSQHVMTGKEVLWVHLHDRK